ncbi:MAG: ATP-binding protein, partial [Bacteroidales bacterium]|nr:ATP-binding protein [Bacteroidales bacterium]
AQFIGRNKEVAHLCNLIREHKNVLIYGPAKIGKKSLVYNSMELLRHDHKDITFCDINLFNIRCIEAFMLRFTNEIVSHFAESETEWKAIMHKYIPSAPYMMDSTSLQKQFTYITKDLLTDAQVEEILMLPDKLAHEYGTHVIFYFRQFQDILLFDDPHRIFLLLEKVWKKHTGTNFIITGDRFNAMEEIFQEKKYFYHFAQHIELAPIDEKIFSEYIIKGFQKAGKVIHPEQATSIYNLVEGDPWYTQHLASICFSLTKGFVNEGIIKQATQQLINLHDVEFHSIVYSLSKYQVRMIKAALEGVTKFTSADVLDKYRLNSSANVSRLKEALTKKEIINFNEKKPATFLDPLFKLWFINYFFAD